ncbi:MAG: hypothetical protein ABI542_02885 [Gemmatimonadota bacterium]
MQSTITALCITTLAGVHACSGGDSTPQLASRMTAEVAHAVD